MLVLVIIIIIICLWCSSRPIKDEFEEEDERANKVTEEETGCNLPRHELIEEISDSCKKISDH